LLSCVLLLVQCLFKRKDLQWSMDTFILNGVAHQSAGVACICLGYICSTSCIPWANLQRKGTWCQIDLFFGVGTCFAAGWIHVLQHHKLFRCKKMGFPAGLFVQGGFLFCYTWILVLLKDGFLFCYMWILVLLHVDSCFATRGFLFC